MHEDSRAEFRTIRQLFGDGVVLVESGPTRRHRGSVSIVMQGRAIGTGPDFRSALRQALRQARTTGIVRRASDLATPPAKRPDCDAGERTGGKADSEPSTGKQRYRDIFGQRGGGGAVEGVGTPPV